MRRYLYLFSLVLFTIPLLAQSDESLSFETIELSASDDLSLMGDLYIPEAMESPAPALLLMHMNGGNRSDYIPLIPALLDSGYVVLTVDLRAHGATGGARNWDLAIEDTQLWLDWLREQDAVDASRIATIGASIGSNLALVGCANDGDCVTAIALSPGTDYFGVMPGDALVDGLNAFLVASHNDSQSANSIRTFFNDATGYVSTRMYPGRAHGTQLFSSELESISNAILAWLDEQLATVE